MHSNKEGIPEIRSTGKNADAGQMHQSRVKQKQQKQ